MQADVLAGADADLLQAGAPAGVDALGDGVAVGDGCRLQGTPGGASVVGGDDVAVLIDFLSEGLATDL